MLDNVRGTISLARRTISRKTIVYKTEIGEKFPLDNVEAVKLLADYSKSIWTLSAGGLALSFGLYSYVIKDFQIFDDFDSTVKIVLGSITGSAVLAFIFSIYFTVEAQRNLIKSFALSTDLKSKSTWSFDNTVSREQINNYNHRFTKRLKWGKRCFYFAINCALLFVVGLLLINVFHTSKHPKNQKIDNGNQTIKTENNREN